MNDPVLTEAPGDTLAVDDFIRQGNAHERGAPAEVSVESVADPVADPAADGVTAADDKGDSAAERNADGTFKPKAAKPRHDPQARIDQVIGEREAARREAAALKAENEALRKANAPPPVAPKPPAPPETAADPEPQEKDFEDYRLYVKAQARWEARQEYAERDAARAAETQQQQAEHEHRTAESAWQTRREAAFAADPALKARIVPTTPMSLPMMHVVKTSPVGVQVLAYLSDHQDEAQRLSTLHPADVLRALGKLEARFDAASPVSGPASPAPVISQAKPPRQPLGTSPTLPDDTELRDDLDVDEFIRRGNALDRKAARG